MVNKAGTATFNNSSLFNNMSIFDAGGIMNLDAATLILNYSTLSNNVANNVEWDWSLGGGGIYNFESTVILNHSTLANNSAFQGGGIASYDGTLTIENSTLSGNVASRGGSIYTYDGELTIESSTLSGNLATSRGGGIYIDKSHNSSLNHTTIADNVADIGNSIYVYDGIGSFTIKNSILAHSQAGSSNCHGAAGLFVSLGFNISSDAGCNFLTEATDLTGIDPLLGSLQDNGGPTLTHALLPGSPAIDSGDNDSCPAVDQRGVARPQGAGCDRGAVEAVAIHSRLDYRYRMNDGSGGLGRYTLLEGGGFVDEQGQSGSWALSPTSEQLWLAYDPGYACDAFLPARLLPDNQVRGLRLCRDGSGVRGFWRADIILAQPAWLPQ